MDKDEWKYEGDKIRIIRRGADYTYFIKDKGLDEKNKNIDIYKNQIDIFDYIKKLGGKL